MPELTAGRGAHPAGQVRAQGRPGRPAPSARLSPGERTRAALALLQARGVNLLVLDEPTNHLDLPAIEQLEQALDGYDGTLLLVSHDRRLLENVRLDQRWDVDAGRVTVADRRGRAALRIPILGCPLFEVGQPEVRAEDFILDVLGESSGNKARSARPS